MRFSLTTWNINSVRLRIDLVAKFLKAVRPDVLCLQETKCIDDAFPLKRFRRLGYEHVALNGQKGYHGVAIVSKLPFESSDVRVFCNNVDSRHISVAFGEKAGMSVPLILHNFYVPAGGDIPDAELNPKFAHKLAFLDERFLSRFDARPLDSEIPLQAPIAEAQRMKIDLINLRI